MGVTHLIISAILNWDFYIISYKDITKAVNDRYLEER